MTSKSGSVWSEDSLPKVDLNKDMTNDVLVAVVQEWWQLTDSILFATSQPRNTAQEGPAGSQQKEKEKSCDILLGSTAHTPIQISRQWKSGRCNKHDNSSIGLDYRQHRGGCLLKHPWGTWAPPALSFLLWGPPTSCGEAAFRNSSGWSVFLQ